jgi:putative ABC transport system permease protein
MTMFHHYLLSAFRQMSRNKIMSLINMVGLAVGLCAFFLISRYVAFEMSYDTFHENANRIFRVAYSESKNTEARFASAKNFIGIPDLVKQHLPEVTAATGFDHTAQQAYFQFTYKGKNFYEPGSFHQSDENFFKVFPSILAKGDPATVLSDPHNLVLSRKMATLIFGDEDPIGKRIENRSYSYSNVESFVITGIMLDVPENAHFHLNFIAKNTHTEEVAPANFWTGPRFYIYLSLAPASDRALVETKLNSLLKELNVAHPKTTNVTLSLQAITDIHNTSALSDELEANGNKLWLYLLSAMGIAILACAWINYVNIESGRFIARSKERGIRKRLGSGGISLVAQFTTEYTVSMILSLLLASTFLFLITPLSGELTSDSHFNCWSSPFWIGSCIVVVAGVLGTGIFLSALFARPRVSSIKSSGPGQSPYSSPLRRGLIAFQFTCSIALIAILMVVHNQTTFMMTTNKGIDVDNVISIRNPTVYSNEDSINFIEYRAFQNELSSGALVHSTTGSSAVPGMEVDEALVNRLKRNLGDPDDPTPYKLLFVDYDYLPFYHLRLKAGRNYAADNGDDERWSTIILNESAARALGFSSAFEAVDKEVYFQLFSEAFEKCTIVGIVEDHHHESAGKKIEPTILSLNHRRFQQVFFSVRLNSGVNPQQGVGFIERTWKRLFRDKPFDFFFQDEYYDRQFRSEQKFRSIFGLFTVVTIFIACLGIVGMTLFETSYRAKEVCVRKVLGATLVNLVALLSISYIRLIVFSSVAAAPIIYFFTSYWLDAYPIRISITAWFFLVPMVVLALLVALAAGAQTLKTVLANPVDQLSHE